MDPVQLIGSFVSIVLLAWLAHKLFPAKQTLTHDSARVDYLRFHPEALILSHIEDTAGKAILFELQEPKNKLGLVVELGDQLVCRTLSAQDIIRTHFDANQLTLFTTDFTQPTVSMRLSEGDIDKAKTIFSHSEALKGTANAT